jgi:hypothetical protein
MTSRDRILSALAAVVVGLGIGVRSFGFEKSEHVDPQLFHEPPREYRQHAWMTYNLSRANEENMTRQIEDWAKRDVTGGFYLGLGGANTVGLSEEYLAGSRRAKNESGIAFLSKEYFDLYAKIIEAGIKNGIPPIVFYDEVGYPSGMAGGYLYSKYPQYGAKSLDKVERDITGPASATQLQIPEGMMPVGAVRMNLDTRELIDISADLNAKSRQLTCDVPAGRWKVMGFYLDPKASLGQGGKSGYVDYLDADAVKAFIEVCYQPHYDHLKQYFGHPLQITQYDEPTMMNVNGKMWTPKFNEGFEKLYGYNPMKYYPALWYDIGPDTAAVRNALWGYRAKLFSESYIKQLDDWCREHGIMYSGHLDQEEATSPVGINGDLMLAFKYQAAPGIDDIWNWGRTNRAYKIIQSSAYNWDKPVFLAETYAAYRQMSPEIVLKVAMDQAAMGANFQVGALPPTRPNSPPPKTPQNDRFIGRLCYMLQHGRHVADVAILYPIHSLQAAYHIGDWGNAQGAGGQEVTYARFGGIVPPEIDYIELGEMIFRGLRQDFTFLHPEALKERCKVEGNQLVLDNPINRESYRVLIIPGGKVMSVDTAKQIKAFYDAGGTVIATKVLPDTAVEKGQDAAIRQMVGDVFGFPQDGPITARMTRGSDELVIPYLKQNQNGGRAYFMPNYTLAALQTVLKQSNPVADVAIDLPPTPVKIVPDYAGSLTYIHKVKDGREIYFFANSTDEPIDTTVTLRGNVNLSIWDPMDGTTHKIEATHATAESNQALTTVPLKLRPVSALFYVQEK